MMKEVRGKKEINKQLESNGENDRFNKRRLGNKIEMDTDQQHELQTEEGKETEVTDNPEVTVRQFLIDLENAPTGEEKEKDTAAAREDCLLYTSPSPRD